MPEFNCSVCQAPFSISDAALKRYPGWEPRYCREHSPKKGAPAKAKGSSQAKGGGARRGGAQRSGSAREENLSVADVLVKYSGGPDTGLFTDGSCSPNPGPGGWGAVWVKEGEILEQRYGKEPSTTNNRMELMALIEALKLLPTLSTETVYSDSQLAVKTLNEWAKGWKARGWARKTGPISNLDLVKEAYALKVAHPRVKIAWIAAHQGNRWNEYADALATAWMRETL